MYHELKKAFILFFFPLSLCIEFLLAGAFMLLATGRQRAGKACVIAGLVLLILFTTYPLPRFMLKSLEDMYPPLNAASVASYGGIRYVVVLSGGIYRGEKTITSILDQSSVIRLDDAIILFRKLKMTEPSARLVVTGRVESPYLALLAEDLGVKKNDIVIENISIDTVDQARLVKEIAGKERFFLVTSASHMPRAMALFKKAGTNPIPAPGDFMAKKVEDLYRRIIPRAENVKNAETAFYEYIGILKEKLAGNI